MWQNVARCGKTVKGERLRLVAAATSTMFRDLKIEFVQSVYVFIVTLDRTYAYLKLLSKALQLDRNAVNELSDVRFSVILCTIPISQYAFLNWSVKNFI